MVELRRTLDEPVAATLSADDAAGYAAYLDQLATDLMAQLSPPVASPATSSTFDFSDVAVEGELVKPAVMMLTPLQRVELPPPIPGGPKPLERREVWVERKLSTQALSGEQRAILMTDMADRLEAEADAEYLAALEDWDERFERWFNDPAPQEPEPTEPDTSAADALWSTGNSLRAARDLQAAIGDTRLVPVAAANRQDTPASTTEAVGFVHMIHYYGLPELVKEFLRKVDLSGASYLFSVVTCDWPHGIPLRQTRELLAGKGRELDAGYLLKMPINFAAQAPSKQQQIMDRAAAKVAHIAGVVTRREQEVERDRNLQDLLTFTPYRHRRWERKTRGIDREFTVSDACNACGICEKVCPVDNIALVDGEHTWKHRCEMCIACMYYCPSKAIRYPSVFIKPERFREPQYPAKVMMRQKTLDAEDGSEP